MKLIISILLTALLAFASGLYLPWWSIAIAAFAVTLLIDQPPFRSFLTGFAGLLLLWFLLVMIINTGNEGVMAKRISLLMGFGGSSFILIAVTCLVGALVGGLGALTGSLMRRM